MAERRTFAAAGQDRPTDKVRSGGEARPAGLRQRRIPARSLATLCAAVVAGSWPIPAAAEKWVSFLTNGTKIEGGDPCGVATAQAKAIHGAEARYLKECELRGGGAIAHWYREPNFTFARPGNSLLECEPGETEFLETCVSSPIAWITRKECWGNPVDVLSGTKHEHYEDYATEGPDPLAFRRIQVKNGNLLFRAAFQGRLGRGWRSNYDADLYLHGASPVVTLPDGEELIFSLDGGVFKPAWIEWLSGGFIIRPGRGGVAHTLAQTGNSYELTTPEGEILVFEPRPDSASAYRLKEIRRSGGLVQILAYGDAADPARNTGVSDNRGRSLSFEYDDFGRMIRLISGGVTQAEYLYLGRVDTTALEAQYPDTDFTRLKSGVAVLEKVVFPAAGGATIAYHYEDLAYPFALTGITDERGTRYATFAYDALGRATLTRHAGGADRTDFAYDPLGGRVTITNALGKQAIVEYITTPQGNRFATAIRGQPSPNCAAADTLTEYDANGFVAKVTDGEGRVTAFENDSRGLPTRIVRGFGTADAVATTLTWNARWRAPARIVEPGRATDLAWDADGRLQSATETDTTAHTVPYSTAGQTRTWTYADDAAGLLAAIDGPLAGPADTIAFTYNVQGFLQTVTNEVGHVTTVTAWNENGQPTSVTDPNGAAIAYDYDARGRLTAVTLEPGTDQTRWTIAYTAAGDVRRVTEPSGAQFTFTWDGARRLIKIENNSAERIEFTRDALGGATRTWVTSSSGAIVSDTSQVFDELGRLMRLVGGETRSWAWGYDRTDLPVSVIDPRSRVSTAAYDALARLRVQTDQLGGTVTLARGAKDDIVSIADPRSLTTSFVRNGFGDVIQETSPDRGTTIFEVDARGLTTKATDARGIVTAFAYDAAGRLVSRAFPASPAEDVTVTWDQTGGGNKGKGRITRISDQSGVTNWTWDARGRLTREVRTISGFAHTVAYAWDGAGRLTQMTYPSGRIVSFGYDALGRANGIATRKGASDPAVSVVSAATYLPFGPLKSLDFGNGLSWRTTWDLETRLKTLRVEPTGGTGAALL